MLTSRQEEILEEFNFNVQDMAETIMYLRDQVEKLDAKCDKLQDEIDNHDCNE